jgi:hypothetical protein
MQNCTNNMQRQIGHGIIQGLLTKNLHSKFSISTPPHIAKTSTGYILLRIRSQLALTIRKISASSSYTAMIHFVTNDWVAKDSSEILVYLLLCVRSVADVFTLNYQKIHSILLQAKVSAVLR